MFFFEQLKYFKLYYHRNHHIWNTNNYYVLMLFIRACERAGPEIRRSIEMLVITIKKCLFLHTEVLAYPTVYTMQPGWPCYAPVVHHLY